MFRSTRLYALGLLLSGSIVPALAQDDPELPELDAPAFAFPGLPQQPPPPATGVPGQPPRADRPPRGNAPFPGRGNLPPVAGAPGMPGIGPLLPRMPMPALSKKTSAILALREIRMRRFTTGNLETAIKYLRALRDAEKTLQTRSEQILEEERRALLALQADDPLPPDSGPKLEMEMERYRRQEDQIWSELEKSLDRPKTDGLRMLLGRLMPPMFPQGGNSLPGPGGHVPGAPGARPERGQPFPGIEPGRGAPPPPRPGTPGGEGGAEAVDPAEATGAAPVLAALPQQPPMPPRAQPGGPIGGALRPGQPLDTGQMPMRIMDRAFFGGLPGGIWSLDDLIKLLEEKLTAMKR